ncbi:unnamed protein product, partial [Durusdinium trenchii]
KRNQFLKLMPPETKRSLIQLARRLRAPETLSVPELPGVPLLLQRLDVRDQQLFDDFCARSAERWKELSLSEMASLFRNTEDYHLLHGTKGTALCRLVASMTEALEPQKPPPPRALASLCHGALAPKRRAACAPLLAKLRDALGDGRSVELRGAEAVELLAAAGELHRAIGVSTPTLSTLAQRSREALDEALSPGQLSLIARACGRLGPVLPEDSHALFEALVAALKHRQARDREPVLQACRPLAADFRRILAQSGMLWPLDEAIQDRLKAIEVRLHLLQDLPLHFVAHDQKIDTHVTQVLLEALQEVHQAPSLTSVATGYMAATTVLHSLALAEETGEVCKSFQDLASSCLNAMPWEEATSKEVQLLFRSPGDVSQAAAQNATKMQDPQALVALLQAAKALSEPQASAVAEAAKGALIERIPEMKNVSELSMLEAATRKGVPEALSEVQIQLRERLRRRLYRAVQERDPVFDARPHRGYISYVEKCMAKDRRPLEAFAEPSSTEDHKALKSIQVTEGSTGAGQAIQRTHRVRWHEGVEAYEAIPTAWPVVGGGAGGGWPAGPRWLLQAVRASEEERRRYGMPRAPSDHEGGTVTNPQQTSLQTLHEHGVGLRKYVHDASCRS